MKRFWRGLSFLVVTSLGSGASICESPSESPPSQAETTLEQNRGWAARLMIAEPDRRRAFEANWKSMQANYGESVDFQLRRRVVLLNNATRPLLYGSPPQAVPHQEGTRPELEKIVRKVTGGLKTDQKKAIALMRFVRDIYQPTDDPRFGGSEESLVNRGDGLCESLSRLMVGLCEISGMPGRVVLHVIGGHLAAEIWVGDSWAYLDARSGIFFLRPDGSMASAWDLKIHPEWLENQPAWVREEISPRWKYEDLLIAFEHEYFHPRELLGLVEYSLNDRSQFTFREWHWQEVKARGLLQAAKEYQACAEVVFDESNAR